MLIFRIVQRFYNSYWFSARGGVSAEPFMVAGAGGWCPPDPDVDGGASCVTGCTVPGVVPAFGEVFVVVEAGADWRFAAGEGVDGGR